MIENSILFPSSSLLCYSNGFFANTSLVRRHLLHRRPLIPPPRVPPPSVPPPAGEPRPAVDRRDAAADIGVQERQSGAFHRRARGAVRFDLHDARVRRADGVLGGPGGEPVHSAERREAVGLQLSRFDIEPARKTLSSVDERCSPQENALSHNELRQLLHHQGSSSSPHRPPHLPQPRCLVRHCLSHGSGKKGLNKFLHKYSYYNNDKHIIL